jgi:hypothetical protein
MGNGKSFVIIGLTAGNSLLTEAPVRRFFYRQMGNGKAFVIIGVMAGSSLLTEAPVSRFFLPSDG